MQDNSGDRVAGCNISDLLLTILQPTLQTTKSLNICSQQVKRKAQSRASNILELSNAVISCSLRYKKYVHLKWPSTSIIKRHRQLHRCWPIQAIKPLAGAALNYLKRLASNEFVRQTFNFQNTHNIKFFIVVWV